MELRKNQFDDVRKLFPRKIFMPGFILPISTCMYWGPLGKANLTISAGWFINSLYFIFTVQAKTAMLGFDTLTVFGIVPMTSISFSADVSNFNAN